MPAESLCPRCGAALAGNELCQICQLTLALETLVPSHREAETQPIAKRFGDYELLEEIGHGGMGVVYKARHIKLKRLVALKLPLLGQFSSDQAIKRFQREAQAAAALRHPNIVGLHEVGEVEGQPYFTMELVEGRSLASLLRAGPLPPRLAAEYGRALARGMSVAHTAGIIHRDLKPANILIDLFDQPRITDFGLAKRLDGSGDLTLTGHLLGSPNYLAPELAAGREQESGPGTDLFALGAILYECLTGRPPFLGSTLQETLLRVRDAEPVGPRVLNPKLPRDLETICLKCLEKEPAKRYASAKDLADEFERYLNDEPIQARPIGSIARAWRWCRRKPALASSLVLLILLVLVVGIGAPISILRTNRARADAEQNLYSADMRLASQAVHEGAFNHARELLEKHRPQPGVADLRGFEWRHLRQAVQESEPFRTLEGLPAPSGWEETLLFRSEHFLYNQSLDQLRAWDMTTWEPVPLIPPPKPASVRWQWDPAQGSAYAVDEARQTVAIHTLPNFESGATVQLSGPISLVTMSSDHQVVAVGFQENASHRVLVWDLAHDVRVGELGNFEAAITNMVFSHDGMLLAASSTNGAVGIWDLKTLQPLSAPPSRASQRRGLEFSPDNQRLLSGKYADLSVWDIGARKTLALERAGQIGPQHFGFTPDAKHLVLTWDGFELALLDSQTLLTIGTIRGHRGRIRGIAFSPDGQRVATASVDQTARIWDLATQMEVGVLGGFDEKISGVEFSADGQSLVLISGFGQIRIHRLADVQQRGRFATVPEPEGISRVALSLDEQHLATISVDGTLSLWDRPGRSLIRSVRFPRRDQENYGNLAFAPDGQHLAWLTGDALRILQVESGEISTTALDGNHDINSIAFSPDGRELAFGCGKQVLIHEMGSGRQQRLAATDDEVFAIKYSPDGARLAFGDRQGALTMIERVSGHLYPKIPKAHPPHVYDIEISPDGRLMATCGADASIKLWRVQSDGLHWQATLHGHRGYVDSVAFSPDGTRLVSASGDNTLKVWDPQRAAQLATLYGHHHMATSVEFAKDGRTIYSAGFDGEIRFWEAPPVVDFDLPTKNLPTQSQPAQSNVPK